MARKRQRPAETEATRLAPGIHDALAQLKQAQNQARQVLERAGLLPAEGKDGHPTVFRPTKGNAATHDGALIPNWDPATRVLRVGKHIVKQYRVPASTQEAILAAFQEEGWPPHIDDPLPPVREGYSKDRLRDAIRHLNSNQKNRLIRFRGDGTGEGVLWDLVDTDAAGRK
jgi:hypothetical protein